MAFSYSVVDKAVPGDRKLTVTDVTLDNSSYVAAGFAPAAADLGFNLEISKLLHAEVLGSGFTAGITEATGKIVLYKSNSADYKQLFQSFAAGLSTSTGALRYRFPHAITVVDASASATTAPVGAAILFDINKNGTTIYTTQGNRPTIGDGLNASAAVAVPDVTAVAAGDYLTFDVDQVGSGTAGSNAVVTVRYLTNPEVLAADLSTSIKVRITALGR